MSSLHSTRKMRFLYPGELIPHPLPVAAVQEEAVQAEATGEGKPEVLRGILLRFMKSRRILTLQMMRRLRSETARRRQVLRTVMSTARRLPHFPALRDSPLYRSSSECSLRQSQQWWESFSSERKKPLRRQAVSPRQYPRRAAVTA